MHSVSNGARTASEPCGKNTIGIPLGLAHAVFLSVGILQVEHATFISFVQPAKIGICVRVLRYCPQCSLIKVN